MKNPWFRMYVDFLNDPKLIGLSFEDQRHFIGVLALKSDDALDDELPPELLDRIVAQRLWIDHAIIREVKRRLIAARLIDENWQPLAWDKRQFQSDSSTGRSRKCREKKRKENQYVSDGVAECDITRQDATLLQRCRDVTATPPDTDTETDKKQSPSLRSGDCKKSATKSNRGSRLPDDWQPSAAEIEFAVANHPLLDWREEAAKFVDYWRAVPGGKGRKLDWSATWRNWLRNAKPARNLTQGNRHANRSELDPVPFHQLSLADQCAARNRARRAERERAAAIEAESFQRLA